jgi:hypothetical protein
MSPIRTHRNARSRPDERTDLSKVAECRTYICIIFAALLVSRSDIIKIAKAPQVLEHPGARHREVPRCKISISAARAARSNCRPLHFMVIGHGLTA